MKVKSSSSDCVKINQVNAAPQAIFGTMPNITILLLRNLVCHQVVTSE